MALEGSSGAIAQPAAARRLTGAQQAILLLSRIWGWVFLAILIVLFTVLSAALEDINFLSLRNSQNILVAIIPILLMGLGETFVIIAGGIDLSVGWVMGLSSVVSALVMRDLVAFNTASGPIVLVAGFLGAAAIGLVMGLANGLIVARLRIPPFIVTLGMSFIARGFGYLLSGANVVGGQPTIVRDFGNEALMYWMPERGLTFFTRPDVAQEQLRVLEKIFPWPVVVTTLVVVFAIYLLHMTQFGRHTFAIGGNREAAVRAGVPVDRHTATLYVLSGLTAGVAGFLHTCRYSGGSAIAGETLVMSSIAAVFIGGVSMFGGVGRVTGTVVGALILAVLQTGLVMLNVQAYWQFVVIGAIVILAVLIDQGRDLIIGRAEAAAGGG